MQKVIIPFTLDLSEDISEKAYLDADIDSGAELRILRTDLERPGIAISLVEAALYLDPDILHNTHRARIGLRDFFTYGDTNPTWTNWCVAIRVETTAGEIRESCWDADEHEWVSPWFDLDTGVLYPEVKIRPSLMATEEDLTRLSHILISGKVDDVYGVVRGRSTATPDALLDAVRAISPDATVEVAGEEIT